MIQVADAIGGNVGHLYFKDVCLRPNLVQHYLKRRGQQRAQLAAVETSPRALADRAQIQQPLFDG